VRFRETRQGLKHAAWDASARSKSRAKPLLGGAPRSSSSQPIAALDALRSEGLAATRESAGPRSVNEARPEDFGRPPSFFVP
jgi:hypothetical protein